MELANGVICGIGRKIEGGLVRNYQSCILQVWEWPNGLKEGMGMRKEKTLVWERFGVRTVILRCGSNVLFGEPCLYSFCAPEVYELAGGILYPCDPCSSVGVSLLRESCLGSSQLWWIPFSSCTLALTFWATQCTSPSPVFCPRLTLTWHPKWLFSGSPSRLSSPLPCLTLAINSHFDSIKRTFY